MLSCPVPVTAYPKRPCACFRAEPASSPCQHRMPALTACMPAGHVPKQPKLFCLTALLCNTNSVPHGLVPCTAAFLAKNLVSSTCRRPIFALDGERGPRAGRSGGSVRARPDAGGRRWGIQLRPGRDGAAGVRHRGGRRRALAALLAGPARDCCCTLSRCSLQMSPLLGVVQDLGSLACFSGRS